jgi:hypothetical protein
MAGRPKRRARNGATPPPAGSAPAKPYEAGNTAALASGVNSWTVLQPIAEASVAAVLASADCPPDPDMGLVSQLGRAMAVTTLLTRFLEGQAAVDVATLTPKKVAQRARRVESAKGQLAASDLKVARFRAKLGLPADQG